MTVLRRLTATIRTRMPAPVVRGLRRGALAWGELTSPWRMLPAVVVVGAQRSGTTTLFRLLEEHPAVVRPTLNKGTGFFDDDFGRGMRWYRGHFPLRWWARRRTGAEHPITFEISGYYLFHPLAAERLARSLPGVKVVAMLRDPVVRAHSAHQHELARGFESEEFEQALDLEPSRLVGEEQRLIDDPTATSHSHRHHAYVGRGRYAGQVQRYVDLLGPDRVHVIEAERFFEDPGAEFAALQEWLGLPRWDPAEVPTWNARPRQRMDPVTADRLRAAFADSDRHLAALLGRPPAWATETPADTTNP